MSENTSLVPTASTALDRLTRSLERESLADFVTARTRRSLLLVDCSASMDGRIMSTNERKIDALRSVVETLLTARAVPVAAFGIPGGVQLVERIPEPSGMTPLHKAIAYGREQGANHLVVVTDGLPDSRERAFEEAAAFGHPIDVFYVGNANTDGAAFCRELAARTGGSCGVTDLAGNVEQKKLAGKIVGLLGDGSEVL